MAAIPENVRELLDRVERRLPDGPLTEKPMFGMVAIMFDGEMIVAAHKDGSILVRVHADDDADLIARLGASRLTMGGREMAAGWILVDAARIEDEAALDFWVGKALERRAR